MKKEKKLNEIAKNVEGNVLVIGVTDEKILKILNDNEKITNCNLLNNISQNLEQKKKNRWKRKFNIRNLRKKFKKKKVDYIICNMADIYPYLKTFVKDSVYINKRKLYFYGEVNKYQLEKMITRYKKYHAEVEQLNEEKIFYITVSNEHSKATKWKDFWLGVCDFFHCLYEMIGDLLIN